MSLKVSSAVVVVGDEVVGSVHRFLADGAVEILKINLEDLVRAGLVCAFEEVAPGVADQHQHMSNSQIFQCVAHQEIRQCDPATNLHHVLVDGDVGLRFSCHLICNWG